MGNKVPLIAALAFALLLCAGIATAGQYHGAVLDAD
jgi:hypothetical protein